MTTYRYKLTNTKHGSDRYGPCEVCKKKVTGNVYLQSEEKAFVGSDNKMHWSHSGSIFGHKSCCMKKRKNQTWN
jgi:hypothetical protein